MSKPWIHAESSARKFGGQPEDYIEIHNLMDSSKGAIADQRHRILTHNSWFLSVILERIFGITITNSAGKKISVRDIGEQHVLEDFKGRWIPTVQDYMASFDQQDWFNNGKDGYPESCKKLRKKKTEPSITDEDAQRKAAQELIDKINKEAENLPPMPHPMIPPPRKDISPWEDPFHYPKTID